MTLTGSNSVGLHSLVKTKQAQDFLTGMLNIDTFFLGSRNELHKTCSARAPYSVQQKDTSKYLGTATECQCAQIPPKTDALENASVLHSGSSVRLPKDGEHSQLKVLLRNFST